MGSIPEALPTLHSPAQPFRVLVAGGAYGGLSVALNLHDLCRGLAPRAGPTPDEAEQVERPKFAVDITIVDERDGYCELSRLFPPNHISRSHICQTT
jgi:hypothetical protein